MTTPTRIYAQRIGEEYFTVDHALFVTPKRGMGMRRIHRINGKLVRQCDWLQRKTIARAAMAEPTKA